MQEELRKLPQQAAQKKPESKLFFKKLKARPPRDLDGTMQELHTAEFDRTDCLQCGNCCRTTGPLFTDRDVGRISRHLRMRPSEFSAVYLREDEEGDMVLQQVPCPFLGADNYCGIYEVRPRACREYPHTDRRKFHQIGELTLKNVAICPAAFRIVEALKSRYPDYL
jgi:Fe-S-cluster containining protein